VDKYSGIIGAYLFSYLLLLSVGLILFRLIEPREYRRRGRLTILTSLSQVLFFFAYGALPALYVPADWPATRVGVVLTIFGLTAIILGLAGLLFGLLRLGLVGSLGRDGGVKLVRGGPYSKSRNPQAVSCGAYIAGFAILWPSWYALGWAGLYCVLIHWMIRAEEEHLKSIHGEAYEANCHGVPRFLPRVWERGEPCH
jgi:protein-S-isoprenylcysteine O-methyltransferase Ste14